MTIARWTQPVAPTRQEQFLLKRLGRVRKLLGFLRLHRHELFDDAFQEELAAMYRTTGAGKEARPPAMMAMAMPVQGYLGMPTPPDPSPDVGASSSGFLLNAGARRVRRRQHNLPQHCFP